MKKNDNKWVWRGSVAALGMLFVVGMGAGCATLGDGAADASETWIQDQAEMVVYGLSCPLCATNLDGQLERIEGVQRAEIDLDSGRVTVTLAPDAQVSSTTLRQAVADAGFTVQSIH